MFEIYPDAFVTTKEKFPDKPHWVIMKFTLTHVPGDERSRTNPGHGYPARDVPNVSYEAYLTEEKFLTAIQRLEEGGHKNHVALKVEPLKITKTIQVSVK